MYKPRIRTILLYPLVLCMIVCLVPIEAGAVSTSLTTTFAGNITFQGNMFDVTMQPGYDIIVTGFDINILAGEGPVPIRVYYREGGYQGYETNESAWTLLQDSLVASSGANTPSPLPLNSGLALTAGKTYGFYITINGSHDVSEMVYVYNASVYSDPRISVSTASGLSWPLFTDPHTPRTWSGTIYYDYSEIPPETGDASTPFLWLGIVLVALAGGSALAVTRRRRRN